MSLRVELVGVEVGTDPDGDPTARVVLIIPDEDDPVAPDGRLKDGAPILALLDAIEQLLKQRGFVPNVKFRTRSEEEEAP